MFTCSFQGRISRHIVCRFFVTREQCGNWSTRWRKIRLVFELGTSPIKTRRGRWDELTIDVWKSTGSELLSVIRRASSGNQSRIRVGSFPGRMSSLPARRLKIFYSPWENKRGGRSRHIERRSRHVTRTRDRTCETKWTQQNPFAVRSALDAKCYGRSVCLVFLWKYDPFTLSLRTRR